MELQNLDGWRGKIPRYAGFLIKSHAKMANKSIDKHH